MAAPRYLATGTTGPTEVPAVQVSTGAANANGIPALNANGLLDASMLGNAPAGAAGASGVVSAQLAATEAIAAGALCNAYSAAGTESVQNADGAQPGTKPVNCYAPAAIASGATGTVVFSKSLITGLAGLTPGPAFLSDATKGGVQAAGSTIAGHTFQKVGEALSATTLLFAPEQPIVRA